MLWFWLVLDVVMVGGAAHVLLSFFSLNDPLAWEDWFDYIFVLEVAQSVFFFSSFPRLPLILWI